MQIIKSIIGTREDCEVVSNKCKNCPKKDQCDFDWIYKLAGAESDLLGYWNTADMKKGMRAGIVLTTEDRLGFCHFHPSYRDHHTTVYHVCVKKEARGQHLAMKFIEYLYNEYKLPVQSVCIEGSSSDAFWSHVAKKIGTKLSRKGTPLNIYSYGEDHSADDKEQLW